MRRGTIVGFRGSWLSGLATLILETEKGIEFVPCDNGPTVRAFEAAFGGVIGPGHTINNDVVRGKLIDYSTDFLGVLKGFTPVEESL